MKRLKKMSIAILSGLIFTGLNIFTPTLQADPPPWAPAHGYRAKKKVSYPYIYYPTNQVYYSPTRRMYYYLDGTRWINAAVLPPRIQLGKSVSIDLWSPRPYVDHSAVIQYYPVVVAP